MPTDVVEAPAAVLAEIGLGPLGSFARFGCLRPGMGVYGTHDFWRSCRAGIEGTRIQQTTAWTRAGKGRLFTATTRAGHGLSLNSFS
jgi:hypothetical protein